MALTALFANPEGPTVSPALVPELGVATPPNTRALGLVLSTHVHPELTDQYAPTQLAVPRDKPLTAFHSNVLLSTIDN